MALQFPDLPAWGEGYASGGASYLWQNPGYWQRGRGFPAVPFQLLSLAPNPIIISGANRQVLVTATGIGFAARDTAVVNGAPTATAFISPTTLMFIRSDTGPARIEDVHISRTGFAGGSNSINLEWAAAPAPFIMSLDPDPIYIGSGAITLRVLGADFANGDVIHVNSAPVTTAFVSTTELTCPISDAGPARSEPVHIDRGGGVLSNVVQLDWTDVPFDITALSPNPILVPASGGSTITITVTGFGFALSGANNTILVDGVQTPTFPNSATQCSFQIMNTYRAPALISYTDGTLTCAPEILVWLAIPALTSLSPDPITIDAVGSGPITVTATGAFASGDTVLVDGTPVTTTFVNATTLTFQSTNAGPVRTDAVLVRNAAGDSATVTLDWVLPPFALTSITPATIALGTGTPVTVRAIGTSFQNGDEIYEDGVAVAATTFVSSEELTAEFSDAGPARTATITVVAAGGGQVAAGSEVLTWAVPLVANNCNPDWSLPTGLGGSASEWVVVNGSGFTPDCTLEFSSSDGITTRQYVSPTQMRFLSNRPPAQNNDIQVWVRRAASGQESNRVDFHWQY